MSDTLGEVRETPAPTVAVATAAGSAAGSGAVTGGRVATIVLAGLCGLYDAAPARESAIAVALLLVLAVVLVTATAVPTGTGVGAPGLGQRLDRLLARASALIVARALVLFGAVLTTGQVVANLRHESLGGSVAVAVPLLVAVVVATACAGGRWARSSYVVALAVVGVVLAVVVLRVDLLVDAHAFLDRAGARLLDLRSPYGGTTANPYTPDVTTLFWDPSLVDGDRLLVGFPYLPASVLPPLLAAVVGVDVRLVMLACLLVAAAVVRATAHDVVGRTLALAVVVSPLTVSILLGAWVEPFVGVLLVVAVHGIRRGSRGPAVVGLVLVLLSKQYVVVALPALWAVRRRFGGRLVLVVLGVAAGCALPFLAVSPGGFWHDVVVTQLRQPYRADSLSLLVVLGNHLGTPPPWLSGALPLTAGLAVSTLVVRRSRLDDATTFALATATSLLATVLVSKQAFPNYYLLIAAALVVTAVTWRPDPATTPAQVRAREPRGEGHRGR